MNTYTTNRVAKGMYDALYQSNGYARRIGFIVGGNGKYLSERANKSLGYFRSIKQALKAIELNFESTNKTID